jgi:hypothetical protein
MLCCLLVWSGCTKKASQPTLHDYVSKMNGVHIWHGMLSQASPFGVFDIIDTFEIKTLTDTSISLFDLNPLINGVDLVTLRLTTPSPYKDSLMFENNSITSIAYTVWYNYRSQSISYRYRRSSFAGGTLVNLTTP